MYPYTETETPLSILSPCVSVREYRGSARRARGLNTIVEQMYETPPPVVSRNITGYRLAIGGKNKHVTQESIILLPAVSRSITGCFATQNIGEVSRSDGGVKEISLAEELSTKTKRRVWCHVEPVSWISITFGVLLFYEQYLFDSLL